MTDLININSDKDLKRFEFLRRSFLVIGIVILSRFLYSLRFGHRQGSSIELTTFDIVVCSVFLFWILTSRIVKQIQIDLQKKKFIVYFMTVLKSNKIIEVPFENLVFTFNKEPSRFQPKKWTLRIYNKSKKTLEIHTGQDGFSQEALESLVQQLKKNTELHYDAT